jgi:hypothetical protein
MCQMTSHQNVSKLRPKKSDSSPSTSNLLTFNNGSTSQAAAATSSRLACSFYSSGTQRKPLAGNNQLGAVGAVNAAATAARRTVQSKDACFLVATSAA